jgi:hypothetical protein
MTQTERIFNNFPKIKNTIALAIKQHKKKAMMEKNSEILFGMPIFKSPNGYIYTVSDVKKSLYCGKCSNSPSNLVPLKKTGCK